VNPVPERRPIEKRNRAYQTTLEINAKETPALKAKQTTTAPQIQMKMWYCKQCGYVCFREDPPYVCPICKAKREMFSQIPT
jgi:ferredoxin-thioredoxin reductase catalytic chain